MHLVQADPGMGMLLICILGKKKCMLFLAGGFGNDVAVITCMCSGGHTDRNAPCIGLIFFFIVHWAEDLPSTFFLKRDYQALDPQGKLKHVAVYANG